MFRLDLGIIFRDSAIRISANFTNCRRTDEAGGSQARVLPQEMAIRVTFVPHLVERDRLLGAMRRS